MRFVGIDLSTKTGLVILNESGQVINDEEITSKQEDPARMCEIVAKIMNQIDERDFIAIEGFSYGSRGRGIGFQFGLGYALRIELYKQGYDYLIVTPAQVKKYATGKGNTSKDNMILPIYKKWRFEHDSDNVRDAYVLARIGYDMHNGGDLLKYEKEIINNLRKEMQL